MAVDCQPSQPTYDLCCLQRETLKLIPKFFHELNRFAYDELFCNFKYREQLSWSEYLRLENGVKEAIKDYI
ncbi:CLUMA_CG019663, isoform A [Clunio marinus]|uniref:CLUMA_CG019663, isoform A n=1 Tax=Clunio marinus TaxID=568069 RepID=A0A1J1J4C3_9DIPT|nr:CLUMA_CG019663, isoform A [Clunio marinus]